MLKVESVESFEGCQITNNMQPQGKEIQTMKAFVIPVKYTLETSNSSTQKNQLNKRYHFIFLDSLLILRYSLNADLPTNAVFKPDPQPCAHLRSGKTLAKQCGDYDTALKVPDDTERGNEEKCDIIIIEVHIKKGGFYEYFYACRYPKVTEFAGGGLAETFGSERMSSVCYVDPHGFPGLRFTTCTLWDKWEMVFSTGISISSVIEDGYVTRYANMAGSALLLFDYLLTLDDERKSWSIGKVLFIILCKSVRLASKFKNTEILLLKRVNNYVLFGHLNASMYSLLLLAGLEWSFDLYDSGKILSVMVASFIVSSASTALVLGLMYNGGISRLPDYSYAVWIPRLAFDTFLCILALIRGFQLAKDESDDFDPSTIPSGKHLMKVLIRDCIGSYLIMFAVYLTFLTIWTKNVNLFETCFNISAGFESIVGTRTILRIRKVTNNGGPDVSASMVNDILK
ncbi:hypothetical protein EV368DRAFT_68599 [Lentinula lateritia]|nr:hypothetical protein EV368DRAFT_68599 [Lentinula lateritia]